MIFTKKIYLNLCTDYNRQTNSYVVIYFFFAKTKKLKLAMYLLNSGHGY